MERYKVLTLSTSQHDEDILAHYLNEYHYQVVCATPVQKFQIQHVLKRTDAEEYKDIDKDILSKLTPELVTKWIRINANCGDTYNDPLLNNVFCINTDDVCIKALIKR